MIRRLEVVPMDLAISISGSNSYGNSTPANAHNIVITAIQHAVQHLFRYHTRNRVGVTRRGYSVYADALGYIIAPLTLEWQALNTTLAYTVADGNFEGALLHNSYVPMRSILEAQPRRSIKGVVLIHGGSIDESGDTEAADMMAAHPDWIPFIVCITSSVGDPAAPTWIPSSGGYYVARSANDIVNTLEQIAAKMATLGGKNLERPSALEGVLVGVESGPGANDAVINRRLVNLNAESLPNLSTSQNNPTGTKANVTSVSGHEWTDTRLSMPLDYNTLVYILASLIGTETPAALSGGIARLWEFVTTTDDCDVPQTYGVESGGCAGGSSFSFGTIINGTFKIAENEATYEGDMIGQEITDQIVMTTSGVREIRPVAVIPKTVGIYISMNAGVGWTKLARLKDFEHVFNGHWDKAIYVDDEEPSFTSLVEKAPESTAKLTVGMGTQAIDLLNKVRNGEPCVIQIRSKGPTIKAGTEPIADPTAAPTVAQTGTGGTWPVGTYYVAYAWTTAASILGAVEGSTRLSPPATIVVSSGSTNIITPTVPAVPAGASGVDIYIGTDLLDMEMHLHSAVGGAVAVNDPDATPVVTLPWLNTTGTVVKHLMQATIPVFITKPDSRGDHDGIYGAVYDAAKARIPRAGLVRWHIINKLATL